MENKKGNELLIYFLRGTIEAAFIIFLFYANLLMGEYTQGGRADGKGLLWAINDICTPPNFLIAIVAATVGQFFFQFLRRKI